jgi:MEDS: MEthanogen/methylotroph, DcmR Sensory domain
MDSHLEAAWILTHPPHHSHIVYPYADDWRLVDAVGFFTASGLDSEGAVILIATEAHRYALKRYLKSDGNIDPLEASGQLSFLDAGEVMSSFMVDGYPDSGLFKDGIRTLINRAQYDEQGRIRDVRLFGEMVNLLWPENREAAERVEELGNEVAAEYSIPILCAYSVGGPGRSQLPDSIINLHSHSIAW